MNIASCDLRCLWLQVTLHLNGEQVKTEPYLSPEAPPSSDSNEEIAVVGEPAELVSGSHSYRLEELAYLRSGDKGDSTNIGKSNVLQTSNSHVLFLLSPSVPLSF